MTDRHIESLALIRRREDISRNAFREHYETDHAPLATPIVQPFRYVRHHVIEELLGDIDFDVMTSFVFADLDAAMRARAASNDSDALRADELRFMDVSAQRVVAVEERDLGTVAPTADDSLWVLMRRTEESTPADLDAAIDASSWIPNARAARRLDGIDIGGAPAFDVALQLDADASLGWLELLEREGHTLWVFRTEAHETPVPN